MIAVLAVIDLTTLVYYLTTALGTLDAVGVVHVEEKISASGLYAEVTIEIF